MRKVIALLLTFICLTLPAFAATIPDPEDSFYVGDFADVISDATEREIVSDNESLYSECGAQIVIVTVTGLGGENIERYAESMFDKWDIGSSEKNNGVLFLMSIGDDDYWAMQGKGLEDSLSSGELGTILDEKVESYFSDGDYDGAAKAFYDAVSEKVRGIYGVSSDTGVDSTDNVGQGTFSRILSGIKSVIKVVVIAAAVIVIIACAVPIIIVAARKNKR